jgi:hypothetical protein
MVGYRESLVSHLFDSEIHKQSQVAELVDAFHTVSLKQLPSMSDGRCGGAHHTGSNPVLTTKENVTNS